MPLKFAKDRPRVLEVDDRKARDAALDKAESLKVKARSKGRCEVVITGVRCDRRAFEVHHHIGGWRRRGRGISALAENKTHACSEHHRLITGNALEHVQGNRYRRVE